MNRPGTPESLERQVQSLWLICAALLSGVLVFTVVAFFWVGVDRIETAFSIMAVVGVVAGAFSYVSAGVVPALIASPRVAGDSARDSDPAVAEDRRRHRLAAEFVTRSILRMALLEGGILMNLVIFLIDRSAFSLGMAVFGLLCMLISLPYPGRMLGWMESQQAWQRDDGSI